MFGSESLGCVRKQAGVYRDVYKLDLLSKVMREREQTITLQTHLYLRTITCQIRSPDLFITMKQPAAGRQIKTLYL